MQVISEGKKKIPPSSLAINPSTKSSHTAAMAPAVPSGQNNPGAAPYTT